MASFSRKKHFDNINTPIVEIFGGAFALLLILFLIINTIVDTEINAMLDDAVEEAAFKVSWESGAEGFVVISFADRLHILETNTSVTKDKICSPNSKFIKYVQDIYRHRNKQIIFAITEGGVSTMAMARNCMMANFPSKPMLIAWIIANKELLKVIDLQDIPAQIKQSVKKTLQN